MTSAISREIYWLTLTLLMTGLTWVPIIINRIIERGAWATLRPPELKADAKWANRLRLAHANAIENLAVFAPLVLATQVAHLNTSLTTLTCSVYFFARLVHVVAYVAAIPVVRTLAFAAGFVCQVVLGMGVLDNTLA